MIKSFDVDGVEVGGDALTVIAGPCVIETEEQCLLIARRMQELCAELGFGYVFKASFDKANRTSAHSYRGPGLDKGLEILNQVRQQVGVPLLTDFHGPDQAAPASAVVQILQVPAFLCRQTDLLIAAAESGSAVNVKKAQFMAPSDMSQVVEKLRTAGCERILLTERGVSFGYQTLVVDFRSLPQMRALGFPVCYDVTHSMQQPGGQGTHSGATRQHAAPLARAAVAVGLDALFIEVHPDPDKALSDSAAQLSFEAAERLLRQVARVRRAVGET